MTELLPAGATYVCEKCKASIGGADFVRVSPLKCWRDDCPGQAPPAPKLTLVKP